ncbi:MAG: DUF397 domain-containing protein [Nocardiopsaceae bacterium]|nr:DUF397 domain-containing protein [Nocardiopsaceae bacterium]
MSTTEFRSATWRKSTYSGSGGNCVEVADLVGVHAVRDSKRPDAAELRFSPAEWGAFLRAVKGLGSGF